MISTRMARMTPEQLEKLMDTGHSPVILDVRSAFEYRAGHIPGAIHAPLNTFNSSVKSVFADKSDQIVLLCEHGPRAQLAKFILKLKGFKNLELLDGHMSRWRRAGREMQPG
jgi:hydroxyacylglutathione hydrolase